MEENGNELVILDPYIRYVDFPVPLHADPAAGFWLDVPKV